MKLFSSKFLLFAFVSFSIGWLSGCGGPVSSQKGPIDEPAQSGPSLASNSSGSKNSGYPRIASAVATAEVRGLDGSVYTINDKLGKIVLLNLWATWCGPCRSEMPALVRMQEAHGAKGFEVIGLNTDEEDVKLINDFAAELKLNYPIAYADTKLQSSLLKISKFPGIPQSFLLDREGRLRGVFRGANPADIRKMEEVVAKVVNESETPEGSAPPISDSEPPPANHAVQPGAEEPKVKPISK